MRHSVLGLIGSVTISTLVATAVYAAGLSSADIDRAAAEGMRLHEAGRSADALTSLERRIADCGTDPDGKGCRVTLRVRAGYIAESQSGAEKDPGPLLQRAGKFYEDALAEDPGHGPALNNLALIYRALGDVGRGVGLLQRGLSANIDMAPTLAVTLGDLLADQQKPDAALDAYRRALRENPDNVTAARRIVDLYRDGIPARIGELPKLLTEWSQQPTLDEAVEYGHRNIVQAVYATDEPLATLSLVAWVELSARHRWLSSQSVATLPTAWKHPSIADLLRYMAAPERPLSGSWWGHELPRRNALAGVALALGQERLGRGDAPGAAARWNAGVAIAPEYGAYEGDRKLRGAWMVRADLHSELASLYFKYPSLDPQRREFARVIQDLFSGKNQVIQLGDKEAMQRFHTVLGLIFAQRAEWQTSPVYMGAIFQLESALRAARDREKERGPQPLPQLKALLGEGYERISRLPEARPMYVQAAAAFLEIDDLANARIMLDRARATGAGPQPQEVPLETILKSRVALPAATPATVTTDSGVRKSPEHAWIFGASLPGVSSEFLARQRFKALADLSVRARDLGASAAATRYAAEALNGSVKNVTTLIDFGDLARLRNVRTTVTAPMRLDLTRSGAPDKTWLLSIPGEATARRVGVSPEVVVAAQVIDTLGANHALLSSGAGSLTIQGRFVHIDTADMPQAREAASKLGGVKDISSVVVRPR